MQKTSAKVILYQLRLGEKSDRLGIIQEIKTWPCYQVIYIHQPESVLENEMHKIHRNSQIQLNYSLNIRPRVNYQEKRICNWVDFADPEDNWANIKESKNLEKYLDFARELLKLRNMTAMVIPVIISARGIKDCRN